MKKVIPIFHLLIKAAVLQLITYLPKRKVKDIIHRIQVLRCKSKPGGCRILERCELIHCWPIAELQAVGKGAAIDTFYLLA
jgi:hypothetical protein